MSVDVFRSNVEVTGNAVEGREVRLRRDATVWNAEQFADEQMRGLVRQVFFSNAAQPVRQVVFSSLDDGRDLTWLCRQVGVALAQEVKGSVAVVGREMASVLEGPQHQASRTRAQDAGFLPLRDIAIRVRVNLWLLPEDKIAHSRNDAPAATALYSRLCEVRTEFDYSLVAGPPARISSEVAALGQIADGIVLVLTAHETRRATARKVKESLENARTRILGIVLNERTFPIPAALYRRL